MFNKTIAIKEIIETTSSKTKDALSILSISDILTDELASDILISAGIANGNANDLIRDIKSIPIWYPRTSNSWVIDEDLREHFRNQLNGKTNQINKIILASLKKTHKETNGNLSFIDKKDLEYQITRFSLKINEEQENGVRVLRALFTIAQDYHFEETCRLINLFLVENIPFAVSTTNLPEYIQSAYFMQGMYQYKKGNYQPANQFFKTVTNNISASDQSIHDAAVAYHLIGKILCRQKKKNYILRWKQAEAAYIKSIKLSKMINDIQTLTMVYHSYGVLLSKDKNRRKLAESVFLQSITLAKRINAIYSLSMVYHSYGVLLSKDSKRWKQAEDAFSQSITLSKEINDVRSLAMIYHSVGLFYRKFNYQKSGEYFAKSIATYYEVSDIDSVNLIFRNVFGILNKLLKNKKYASIFNFTSGFLQEYKDNVDIHLFNVKVLLDQKRHEEALHYINLLVDNYPKSPKVISMRANIYKSMGEEFFSKAKHDYKLALRLEKYTDPQISTIIRHNLALLLSEMSGEQEEILDLWRTAISINPKYVWSYLGLGNYILNVIHNKTEAENILKEGLIIADKQGILDAKKQIESIISSIHEK